MWITEIWLRSESYSSTSIYIYIYILQCTRLQKKHFRWASCIFNKSCSTISKYFNPVPSHHKWSLSPGCKCCITEKRCMALSQSLSFNTALKVTRLGGEVFLKWLFWMKNTHARTASIEDLIFSTLNRKNLWIGPRRVIIVNLWV